MEQHLSDRSTSDKPAGNKSGNEVVVERLALWAKREGRGLARVEYASEFARQRVVEQLRAKLKETGVAVVEVELPARQDAVEVVRFLQDTLAANEGAVVSVFGFASAFQAYEQLEEALRVVNFNRERLVAFPVRQIWWMTPMLLQLSLYAMPDMNGWFNPRLLLADEINEKAGARSVERDRAVVIAERGGIANFDDAKARSRRLLAGLEAAQKEGASDWELLKTYLLSALKSLAEVGAVAEIRLLFNQYNSLLDVSVLAKDEEAEPTSVAYVLNELALLYELQGLYSKAELLYEQTLEVTKAELGNRHSNTATSLDNLARLYRLQGRYSEAEPLHRRALEITKAELGNRHSNTATSLNNLAGLYELQGRYSEAELLYKQALEIYKAELGNRHPDTATSLDNLAGLYRLQGRYSEAEPLLLQALEIYKAELGDHHPDTATSLNNLAELYRLQERYSEAEPLYLRAFEIYKAELGNRHPSTATSLNNLALLYFNTNRPAQAAEAMSQAHSIYENQLGSEHPYTLTAKRRLSGIQQAIAEAT